jgi:type IX secretion system PorP/SprF family membrane protein
MKTILLSICFTIAAGTIRGQSYHFSQFFSTPLLTNPANTGFTVGPYRFTSNIRSQGLDGGNAYFTGYVSADVSPLRNHLTQGHKAGLGLYVMNDRSLNSAVQTSSIGVSAAYHVGLDAYGEQSIGIGVQGTYNQRRIDYSKLTFENQYGSGGYDPSLSIGEPLDVNSRHFFDLNAGMIYNATLEDKSFFAGVAVYNILRRREILTADEFVMPLRFTFQSGGQFWTGEYGKIYVSVTTMSQAKATELTFGSAYGHQLTDGEKSELVGGMWYRYKDALIPYLGYQTKTFQVGLSYDHTVSAIKTASQLRNGYELTFQYTAPDKRELKVLIPWY